MLTIEVNGVRIQVPSGGAVAIRDDDRMLLTIRENGIEPGEPIRPGSMWINRETLPALCGRHDCPLTTWIGDLEDEKRMLERMIAERAGDESPSVRLGLASLERRLKEVTESLEGATRPRVEITVLRKEH